MRTLINRGEFTRDEVLTWIDTIMSRPERIVRTELGVAFIGWVPARRDKHYLGQIVVGPAGAIARYTSLAKDNVQTDADDWRVAVMPTDGWGLGLLECIICDEASRNQIKARMTAAMQRVPDEQLARWYFSVDAQAHRDSRTAIQHASQ